MELHQQSNSHGNFNYNAWTYIHCEWPHHFHSNLEIVYVMRGSIEATVDFNSFTMNAGDFALIYPNQLHSLHTPDESVVWIVVFSEEYVFRFISETDGLIGEKSVFHCSDETLSFISRNLIKDDADEICMRKACLYALCSEYRKTASFIKRSSGRDDLLFRITDYVTANFRQSITMRSMSDALGFEYHYLSRRFHRIFNINFCRFVNQYRINYANELLDRKSMTMTEIAFECGFQNVRSFNMVYRDLVGVSPRERQTDK